MPAPDDTDRQDVPFLDLKRQLESIRGEIRAALDSVLDDGRFTNGPPVASFEHEFATYGGFRHVVAVNTGTSALHLALRCLDVGPGDEVVTVGMTFVATAWPILYVGATPVFIDVDPVRFTMDPAKLEAAITRRTKAIIVVHLYGQMADMRRIGAVADAHGVPVIEDCAQSVGATHAGRGTGTIGKLACFSFYPSKNLGAYGEGGAVATEDPDLAERCKRLRDHAQRERYLHDDVGYNYRLNSFQGAVLSVKLRHLEEWTTRRARLAAEYDRLLAGGPVVPPAPCPDGRHVYHLYVARHPDRDALRVRLLERGIHSAVHYPLPVHLQPVIRRSLPREESLPVTEQIARTCVSLPLYPEMPMEHVSRVASAIDAVCATL